MVELKLCRRSELHGKNLVLAPAVVDAVEQVDVALYAPQLLFRLARRVDKLGFVGAEAVNEPLPVVLVVVQLHEMDDTLNHLGSEGIGVATPGFQQDGQRFLINLCADTLELCKGGVDAEDASRAAAPLKAHMQPRFLGGGVELARRLKSIRISITLSRFTASSEPVGSSARIIGWSQTMALAMATL